MVPVRILVVQERFETAADDFVICGQAAEIEQGRIDVDETDDSMRFSPVLFAIHTGREPSR